MRKTAVGALLLFAWLGGSSQVLYPPGSGGGGSSLLSPKVVYASKLSGIPASTAVVPGSSASGTADSAAIINAALSGGNVDLEVDGGYALSTHLAPASNTTIHCIAPQYGFIMQAAANDSVIINSHPNAPTTASGTGGYLVSNQTDQNIVIRGCTLNDNATQSVTGSNPLGTPHTVNPTTGLIVPGVEMIGVNGVTFDSNETYDSGSWSMVYSNDSNVVITKNYIHQPLVGGVLVPEKNTDGIDLLGPDQYVFENGNNITAGDDSIVIAAQGDNYNSCTTGSGGYYAATQLPGMKWGPITDVHIDNTLLNANTYFGLRIQTNTELVDRVSVTNTTGLVGAQMGFFENYSGCSGSGNIGKVIIDGWNVQSTGALNPYDTAWLFYATASFNNLQIKGVTITNPAVTWPVLTIGGGSDGILSLRDWDLNTQSSTFSNVVALTGGTIGQIAASGMNWYDNTSNTGSFFSGSVVPTTLTVSNYAGPNRLLGSGFVPTFENGDAFTNTYPAATTTYVNTIFNEQTSGTALVGTAPATCSNGCTGTWTAAANSPALNNWEYGSGGLLGGNAGCTSGFYCPATMTVAGVQNYTIRFNFASTGNQDFAMVFRWTNASNTIFAGCSGSGGLVIYDVVSGTPNLIASGGSCVGGNYSIVASGTSITLNAPGGPISGTVSGSNTGTAIGPMFFGGTSGAYAFTISSFSVKSN